MKTKKFVKSFNLFGKKILIIVKREHERIVEELVEAHEYVELMQKGFIDGAFSTDLFTRDDILARTKKTGNKIQRLIGKVA